MKTSLSLCCGLLVLGRVSGFLVGSSLTSQSLLHPRGRASNPPLCSSITSSTTEDDDEKDDNKAIAGATFSLVKAMVGSGVLSLPAGLAAVGDSPSLLWPANVLLLVLGVLSAYTFSLYGRLTHETQASSLGDLWRKVYQTDESWLLSSANLAFCVGCALSFTLVIADSLGLLASAAGCWFVSRPVLILGTTATVILPLCSLPSLKALEPFSILGVIGTLVSTAFLAWRCPAIVPHSPYSNPAYLATLPAAPLFNTYNRVATPAPLVLVAMACVSLMAHFSAPDFYNALNAHKKTHNKSVQSYNQVTILGYLTTAILNALTLTCGFLTFGGASLGVVLNNYAASDGGASLSRLLVTLSVMGGYPFVLNAARSSAMDLAGGGPSDRGKQLWWTRLLVGLITGIALLVQDAGFVVSFNGALMGASIIYIFPALLFLKFTQGTKSWERVLNRCLVGFGGVAAAVGGVASIVNSYFPELLVL